MAYITNKQLQKMNYTQLGKAIVSGELSEARLKSYFTDARKKAMDRARTVQKTTEFGDIEKPKFSTLRNLPTMGKLVREIADINRYLEGRKSTITGLKARRAEQLANWEKHGFTFVNESNYADFMRFLDWFKHSEFIQYYDSNDDEVAEVFEAAEKASPEEWQRLFKEFRERKKADGEEENDGGQED